MTFTDLAKSNVRTIAPLLVGLVLTLGLRAGVDLHGYTPQITVMVTGGYYVMARTLEQYVSPRFGWLLGSAGAPQYARQARGRTRVPVRRLRVLARLHAAAMPPASRSTRARIVVVNVTTAAAIPDSDVKAWTVGIRRQAVEFAHDWGLLAPYVAFKPRSYVGRRGETVVTVLDDADQADALGYHDELDSGVTYARVFAVDCRRAGVSVSSCLSHEVLEALADLFCDRWVQAPAGWLAAVEVCDPVEGDAYTDKAGVELSSYVLPSWFDPHGQAPYDRLGKVTGPFTMTDRGYMIRMAGGRVTEVYGNRAAYNAREAWRKPTKHSPLSRTRRRLTASR